jgi:predicted alpha-1,2-mannosidase
MRTRHCILDVLLAALVLWSFSARASSVEEVNPFIGTGGAGFGVGSAWPGPCVPFGLARPGPDTAKNGTAVSFYHCGGYYYGDHQIRGFSHTRLSGIGVPEYGNVSVMPVLAGQTKNARESAHRSAFHHASETARPGYYAVTLADSNIRAELTATAHCGLHRYTFPAMTQGRIVINALASLTKNGVSEARLEVSPDGPYVSGQLVNRGDLTKRNGGVETFFAIRLSTAILTVTQYGQGLAEVLVETKAPVEVAVGLSYISVEQARRHLAEEVGGRSFEAVREEAESKWGEALGRIEVTGGTADERAMFATALYHAQIMPTDFTEAGGLYRGLDDKVHRADGFKYYTDFSLWDTFRTVHPLLNLIQPQRSADMMQSLTLMAAQGGVVPRWPTAYRYTACMIGDNAANVIAEAYLKGIRGFDAEAAYAALRAQALTAPAKDSGRDRREGLEEYLGQGYVPADRYRGAASWTIEMSYNDYCLARLAQALGKDDDYQMFMARSGNWRNLWDPKTGYLRGRKADGSFKGPFLPWAWAKPYVEGNARQWTWSPLHDVPGLIELMGGPAPFAERLDQFFVNSARRPDTFLWDNFYWHGNEPDIHAAYLFDYAGRPDLTQKWVRWAMKEKYHNAPGGLDGNDDCGTLSAWYIFSALGFYPVAGSDLYLVGSPLFERAVIHRPAGDLIIRAAPDPEKNPYVISVAIAGKPLAEPWFRHEQIAGGGEIVFTMSESPQIIKP